MLGEVYNFSNEVPTSEKFKVHPHHTIACVACPQRRGRSSSCTKAAKWGSRLAEIRTLGATTAVRACVFRGV